MKATLEFDLPEDDEQFNIVNNGVKYYGILNDISNVIRSNYKYDKSVEDCFEEIKELMEEFDFIG